MAQQIVNRNLYWLRQQQGLLQKEVAKKIDTPRSTYVFYEDERIPPEDVLRKLSKLYEVAVEDLLEKEMMPGDLLKTYRAKREVKKSKQETEIGEISPFDPDDPLNWERAKLIALQRKLALGLSMIYGLLGKPRGYEDCLDDIDDDTTMILADLRSGRISLDDLIVGKSGKK